MYQSEITIRFIIRDNILPFRFDDSIRFDTTYYGTAVS